MGIEDDVPELWRQAGVPDPSVCIICHGCFEHFLMLLSQFVQIHLLVAKDDPNPEIPFGWKCIECLEKGTLQ